MQYERNNHWHLINNIINHEYENKYYHAGIISAYERNDLTVRHERNEHKHYSKSLIIAIICIPQYSVHNWIHGNQHD